MSGRDVGGVSFGKHLPEAGYDIGTVRESPGDEHLKMTVVYTHALNGRGHGVPAQGGAGAL